jgi:hypothetical protein
MTRPYGIHIGAVVQYRRGGADHAAIVIDIPDTDYPEFGTVILRVLVPRVTLLRHHDKPTFLEPSEADFDTVARFSETPCEGYWTWGKTHPLYDITGRG